MRMNSKNSKSLNPNSSIQSQYSTVSSTLHDLGLLSETWGPTPQLFTQCDYFQVNQFQKWGWHTKLHSLKNIGLYRHVFHTWSWILREHRGLSSGAAQQSACFLFSPFTNLANCFTFLLRPPLRRRNLSTKARHSDQRITYAISLSIFRFFSVFKLSKTAIHQFPSFIQFITYPHTHTHIPEAVMQSAIVRSSLIATARGNRIVNPKWYWSLKKKPGQNHWQPQPRKSNKTRWNNLSRFNLE